MNRLLPLLPLAALLGGCIIYDTDGKCRHCVGDDDDWYSDTGSNGGGDDTATTGDDGAGDDTGDDQPDVTFTLDPAVASPGDTFIASLTADEGFDLGTIESIEFYSGVSVAASSLRQDELLLTLVVDGDAALGDVDMLLQLTSGDVEFVEGALTLVAPGTADGGGSSGDGGSTGDGGGTSGGSTGDGGSTGGDTGTSGNGCN